MFLGIEIGATKLQLGVGRGDGTPLVELCRCDVELAAGAEGIRRQIETTARGLIERHGVRAVGIGFGGPVDAAAGRTITSHQVEGWADFPLADWCRQTLGLPAALANDSDSAGLAEALFGAGRSFRVVFYNNVGSGIGGALVIGGQLYSGSRGVASELGHLRPGPQATRPDQTIEAVASGFGISAAAQAWLKANIPSGDCPNPCTSENGPVPSDSLPATSHQPPATSHAAPRTAAAAADLWRRCQSDPQRLSGKMVAEAAGAGNPAARAILRRALRTLGWGIAQMITLLAPEVVVMGGGVPLVGEALFFEPLRREVARYVFPPLRESYRIVPAELGEEVVVYGALAIAARGG
ncbi:MAG: ROK family protein [Thermoguttaceae bacterium]|jgi:glucokinase